MGQLHFGQQRKGEWRDREQRGGDLKETEAQGRNITRWFSTGGDSAPFKGHWATLGDVSGHNGGRGAIGI